MARRSILDHLLFLSTRRDSSPVPIGPTTLTHSVSFWFAVIGLLQPTPKAKLPQIHLRFMFPYSSLLLLDR